MGTVRRLLSALVLLCAAVPALAQDRHSPELLRRSIDRHPLDAAAESMPGGPVGKSPLATGYYIIDNDAPDVPATWAPIYSFVDTTGPDATTWRRIRSGPNQVPMSDWSLPGSQGKEFFWNPSVPNDSTDNALAGPISIGFSFYYYGRAYDSFYVSTNGLVALTNRRYIYGESGNRIDYNPFRDDTLVRPRVGANAQADPTPDDYGWRYVALGNTTSPLGGIRNPVNTALPASGLRSTIAALWSDQELSQYDTSSGRSDDFGRVYWRRDPLRPRLVIYFVNLSLKGTLYAPGFETWGTQPRRSLRVNMQVVLDAADSSVQINYTRFDGCWTEPVMRLICVSSAAVHASNSTIGLQSNGDVPAPCTAGNCPGAVGTEYTNYLHRAAPALGGRIEVDGDGSTPHPSLAIRFKQWRNIARPVGVTLRIPNRNIPSQYVAPPPGTPTDNYELLLGHPTLGAIQPVAVVQNVSDSIGPVNRTSQPIRVSVTCRIRDIINCTAPAVYQASALSDPIHPLRVSSPSQPSTDTVTFSPFVTRATSLSQLGRFRIEVAASGASMGETWPFDDTTWTRIHIISRLAFPQVSTFSDFSLSCEDGFLPNVTRWVTIGAQVVDGELNTWNPPAPQDSTTGSNGHIALRSPVVRMDRRATDYSLYSGSAYSGDTLISFPIDLTSAVAPVIFLSYHRGPRTRYDRGWSDQVRVGPEQAVYNTAKNTFLQMPDRLVVEFAEPSPDGVENITNVRFWNDRNFGDTVSVLRWNALTGRGSIPRWGVFGGGGGSVLDTAGRIVVDELDPGRDLEFRRAYIPIPRRWFADPYGRRDFRFRIMVEAADNRDALMPSDDDDPFFIDNVRVVSIDQRDIEVRAVGADWPYTIAPASQARAIPMYARVANNGVGFTTAFGLAVFVQSNDKLGQDAYYNYYRFRTLLGLPPRAERTEVFPSWNAQECGHRVDTPAANKLYTGLYRISAKILPAQSDVDPNNDMVTRPFGLTLGSVFAYDDTLRVSGTNDVPTFSGSSYGRGLDLAPSAEDPGFPAALQPFGPVGGNMSGSFAARFSLTAHDSILGYQAHFGTGSASPDYVLYALYRRSDGDPDGPPDTLVAGSRVYGRRGEGTPVVPPPTHREYNYDQYVTYLLPRPVYLEPGEYFVSVSQTNASGIELGGSKYRQGQTTTVCDAVSPTRGVLNVSPPIHPEMQRQRFWFEAIAESGDWREMIQPRTNPGFPHLRYDGMVGAAVPTYTRGSWIPMIRPYFGPRAARGCAVLPVELAAFDVTPLPAALRLDWRTASETSNRGFGVERRVKGDGAWSSLAFVPGAGTSNREQTYGYVDADVLPDTTYQYRLRQEDLDGAIGYSPIREGRLAGHDGHLGTIRLGAAAPNPFTSSTAIAYALPPAQAGELQIINSLGFLVRAFDVAGHGNVAWDGTAADGTSAPAGVYVYRLAAGGVSIARTLTLVR